MSVEVHLAPVFDPNSSSTLLGLGGIISCRSLRRLSVRHAVCIYSHLVAGGVGATEVPALNRSLLHYALLHRTCYVLDLQPLR